MRSAARLRPDRQFGKASQANGGVEERIACELIVCLKVHDRYLVTDRLRDKALQDEIAVERAFPGVKIAVLVQRIGKTPGQKCFITHVPDATIVGQAGHLIAKGSAERPTPRWTRGRQALASAAAQGFDEATRGTGREHRNIRGLLTGIRKSPLLATAAIDMLLQDRRTEVFPMLQQLKEIAQYRDLLYMLAWRDIAVKYKQSIMGFMWAILMPLLIVLAGVLVRHAFSRLSGEPVTYRDIAEVSVKAVPWAFFVASLRFSTQSLIANSNLVTKIYFPRELFPLAAIISQLFDLAVASVALVVLLAVAGIGVSIQLLWVPLLIAVLVAQALALGFLFSALALFFRDVKYLVEVILTFGIFFTPVFYNVELLGDLAPVLMLNPVAPILEGLGACIVHQQTPPLDWLAYSAAVSLAALGLSYKTFRALEPSFAEYI